MTNVTELHDKITELEAEINAAITWAEQSRSTVSIRTNPRIEKDSRVSHPPQWLERELSKEIDAQAMSLICEIIRQKVEYKKYLEADFVALIENQKKSKDSPTEFDLRLEALNPNSEKKNGEKVKI